MNNNEIRICCLKSGISTIREMVNEFYFEDEDLISRMVWDDVHPDYVVATQHVYSNNKLLKKFKELTLNPSVIRIFAGGEAVAPEMNVFDYALVFNHELRDRDRICSDSIFHAQKEFTYVAENDITYDDAQKKLNNGLRFCNFIYSNPNAHPMRDQLFYEISKYKQVDSLGMHLHNADIEASRYETDWCKISIDQKSNYKFTIAAENALFEGYTSEKLISTLQAHSIPIYFGNPDVVKEFNPETYINVNDYSTIEDLIERIKEIDANDDLWCKMVSSPWQTDAQREYSNTEAEKYRLFIRHIFEQNLQNAKRRPEGTWPEYCFNWFTRDIKKDYSAKRIKTIIKKIPYKLKVKR